MLLLFAVKPITFILQCIFTFKDWVILINQPVAYLQGYDYN